MKYEFDIDKIVNYLEPISNNLSNLFQIGTDTEKINKLLSLKILSNEETDEINELKYFEKEVKLKDILHDKLNKFYPTEKEKFNKLCLWIIKDWGGITSAKDLNTLKLIHEVLHKDKKGFNRVASFSKVCSFYKPEEYIIYDSRLAYSLDWIILSTNAGESFFPIPEGRNSKMIAFDMNVLIRMKNIGNYKVNNLDNFSNKLYINNKDKIIYIDKKNAYSELNTLIKEISKKLWKDEKYIKNLYYTEMLLYLIADTEIFKDITNKISLTIK